MEAIIDTHIKTVVEFHDILHGFRASRGTGTAFMDINMAQDITSIFLVFLDLWKAYSTLESGRLLQNLEGYWMGPKMWGILEEFWENQ